ncbi:MAG: hypothetical protein ABSH11_02395 [Verrucomicrobiota bacterium]
MQKICVSLRQPLLLPLFLTSKRKGRDLFNSPLRLCFLQKIDGVGVSGFRNWRLAKPVAFVVFSGADSISLLAGLEIEGICTLSGSAYSAGSLEPSLVIVALGRRAQANSLVLFSLGQDLTA